MTTAIGVEPPAPLSLYSAALRRTAAGDGATLDLVDGDGRPMHRVDPAHWYAPRPGDHGMLSRCAGPTLDVGCGPGRLAAALGHAGLPALGVDICPEAVRQTRGRGAAALRRDVFGPLPGEGRWRHILLADGNVGIGGDPGRLLRRCRALLHATGSVLVETGLPGTASWCADVALRDSAGRTSTAFPWAVVAAEDLTCLATAAHLRVLETWTEAHRWFAALTIG